jgi:hypothetical protein
MCCIQNHNFNATFARRHSIGSSFLQKQFTAHIYVYTISIVMDNGTYPSVFLTYSCDSLYEVFKQLAYEKASLENRKYRFQFCFRCHTN